eukprot:11913137-Alexandrium_andersonii.AAC.1
MRGVPGWRSGLISSKCWRCPASEAPAGFKVVCHLQCGFETVLDVKPGPVAGKGGRWPQFWCKRCKKQLRLSGAVCARCTSTLALCSCVAPTPTTATASTQRRGSRDLRELFA